MIKIISFNDRPEQIGGAQIPAHAFNQWMKLKGFESRVITKPEQLGNTDWYFLATPGSFEGGKWKIDKPFAVMIHAEFDSKLYPDFEYYVTHPLCKLVVTITKGWDAIDKPKLHWHPCTYPQYLITEKDEFSLGYKEGIIYAARLSAWKRPDLLASLTKYRDFLQDVGGIVDIVGLPSSNFDIEDGHYNRFRLRFDSGDFGRTKDMFSKYKYVWDYAYHPTISKHYKRLNLAAYEAMKFGCLPLINPQYSDPMAFRYAITLEDGFPKTDKEYELRQRIMKEVVLAGNNSYLAVSNQIEKIIGHMV